MRLLRSLIFNGLFIGVQGVFVLVMVFALPFPRMVLQRMVRYWTVILRLLMHSLVGIRFEVRGLENIPDEPAVYACKHQSAWETFAFYLLIDDPVYVFKKELMDIPIWGHCARKARAVPVDRKAGPSAIKKLVADVDDRIESGISIVIFPEGTRTMPGAKTVYQPGIAAIYARVDAPVIPVALNSGLFWPRRTLKKTPGTIVMSFLPAIEKGLSRRAFMAALQDRIEAETAELIAESQGSSEIAGPDAAPKTKMHKK